MKPQNKQLYGLRHSAPFKLAYYYAICFSVLCIILFWVGERVLARTIRDKQWKAIENKAQEYRAWYQKGDIEQLDARMKEQNLQADDILFLRVTGGDVNYLKCMPANKESDYLDGFSKMSPTTKGRGIEVSGENWIIASLPIEGTNLILQAGKNSKALENTLSEFRYTAMSVFIPGSLICLLTGAFLAYRFLSPIRKIAVTMSDILESGDLSRRSLPDVKSNELNVMIELFNELLNRNEKLISVMHQSLDNIAHDLRTPLSRIKMNSERALTIYTSDSSSHMSALEACAEEVEYIEQLLTVLMDVAEAESGAVILQKRVIPVHELLQSVVDLYEFVAEDKRTSIIIDCEEGLEVNVDKVRVLQCLANLLDNAIKYSDEATSIFLRAIYSDGWVQISIQDEGIGLLDKDLPYIWDRLYRADQSRAQKGMGLGLNLVKAIVEVHGGKAIVESTSEKGSTFSLYFPHK